jgi:hypothetical protein
MLKHRAIYTKAIDPKSKATFARNEIVRDMDSLLQPLVKYGVYLGSVGIAVLIG